MLQSGVFQIDAGAKLKLAALSLDYSTDFWGTSHILNFIEGGANATLTGNFTLDASSAGDYAAYGQWSLQKNEDSKEVSMVWTAECGSGSFFSHGIGVYGYGACSCS